MDKNCLIKAGIVIRNGRSYGADYGHVHECSRNEINRSRETKKINCYCPKKRLEEDIGYSQRICIFWIFFRSLLMYDRACILNY